MDRSFASCATPDCVAFSKEVFVKTTAYIEKQLNTARALVPSTKSLEEDRRALTKEFVKTACDLRQELLDQLHVHGIAEETVLSGPKPSTDQILDLPKHWDDKAEFVARRVSLTSVPFFPGQKLKIAQELATLAQPVLQGFNNYVSSIFEESDRNFLRITHDALSQWQRNLDRAWINGNLVQQNELPFFHQAAWAKHNSRSELPSWLGGTLNEDSPIGSPYCFVGWLHLPSYSVKLSLESCDRASSRVIEEPGFNAQLRKEEIFIPVVLDLDRCGGFRTESREVIESAVLQLLENLPPGQVKIDAVDPVALGDSLSFLYGLSDANLLGEAIWTTPAQTAQLLTDLEHHITFVTQKYLQGQYNSLTAYNQAAGEVAEPYRVVLLYDFPRMFTRDQRFYDDEALDRISRLIEAGTRCGVFFMVQGPRGDFDVIVDRLLTLNESTKLGLPQQLEPPSSFEQLQFNWQWTPPPVPTLEQRELVISRVLRGLASSSEAKVLPNTVSRIARSSLDRRAGLGLDSGRVLADVNDEATWWCGSSESEIVSHFGRVGASEVGRLVFNSEMESSALIGGRPGSGKSFLFHSIIFDLVLNYGPDELDLYLIDLKEGVEFKPYGQMGLPHARAVAIESNREFAVSVLRSLDEEIRRRGTLFKQSGGATVNLAALRREDGRVIPRVVLMIDEFHKLFEKEDALRREAEQLLERVIKEGRAFGVHVILGSQSIALVGSAFRSIAEQIYYRLVMACSEADSRLLLGERNPDANLLTRPGEGLLNDQGGIREANSRFMTTYWDPEFRLEILKQLRRRADAQDMKRCPVVFEGTASVPVESLDRQEFGRSNQHQELDLVVGAPMSLDGPFHAVLDRTPGRNVLVIDEHYSDQILAFIADLSRASIQVDIVDFGMFGSGAGDAFTDSLRRVVTLIHWRRFGDLLRKLVGEVRSREENRAYRDPARVLVLAGIQRARDLKPEDWGLEETDPSMLLKELLEKGPEVGIHVIAGADRPVSVERRLSSGVLREFGIRIVGTMSATDSHRLVDVDTAANLRESEVYFDDADRVVNAILRRLTVSNATWIDEIGRPHANS